MITVMSQTTPVPENNPTKKAPLPIWQAILLLIGLAFLAVGLFGAIIFLFISGVQQLGLPPAANVVVFILISAVFAWLVKRITDIVSGMSGRWFPEEVNTDR